MIGKKIHFLPLFILIYICLPTFFAAKAFPSSWLSPIGIPDPGFGILDIRPSRPNPWNAQQPGYYYINFQIGSDANNAYGTPTKPRQTIPDPVPAGSYVEVHGTYTYAQQGAIFLHGLGTSGPWVANTSGPVWIVGQDTSSKPSFTGYLIATYGRYIYLDLIDVNSSAGLQIGSASGLSADHIVIRNSDIVGDGVSDGVGIRVIGASGAEVQNVVLYNNTIHDQGDVNSPLDQDAIGVDVDYYTSNIWILYNTINTTSGPGVRLGGAYPSPGPEWTNHIYAGRNTIYNTRQAGLGVKYASDIILSQNHVYNIIDTPWSPSKGFIGQYAPKRMWILYNTIHGMRYGIYMPSTDGNNGPYQYYAIGNLIYNIHHISGVYAGGSWDEAGIMMYGGTSQYIINNTIYNSDAGINGSGDGNSYYIENNIISKITEAKGNHVFIENAIQNAQLKNSLLYQPGGSERIKWGSSLYNSLTSFQASTGKGQGSLAADPLFVAPAAQDFRIAPTSPAKDTGLADTSLTFNVYAQFKTLYGLDIAYDIVGTPRPQQLWDIGAYEINQSGIQPSPPRNLQVVK